MMEVDESKLFAIINNIPKDYRSSDLRNYFSQFIESGGFDCFHFRHRPEVQKHQEDETGDDSSTQRRRGTQCCVVKMKVSEYTKFVKMYNKRHWLDKRGDSIPALCYISKVKVAEDNPSTRYMTRKEEKAMLKKRQDVTLQDLMKLPELNPPVNIMPNGNVGTKTQLFLDLIAQCKLPPNVISKLGLVFPKRRSKRRYGCVSFDYKSSPKNSDVGELDCDCLSTERDRISVDDDNCQNCNTEGDQEVESASGHVILGENDFIKQTAIKKKTVSPTVEKFKPEDDSSEDDNDRCEEWERHEALHDDPANVERNKERLFEEEIELKWEKGGSGLVFYTDAQYWQQQEGDFDEQTADDWDVDMSCYYEEHGGDKDARDLLLMRQEKRRREGEEATDMVTAGFMKKKKSNKGSISVGGEGDIGKFEKHTKGVGRKVLERQGWKEGEGLGGTVKGMASALESEGQGPADKRGIGYYGEKVARFAAPKPQRQLKDFVISTIYDNPEQTDPREPLLRRQTHHQIKHRQQTQ